MKKCIFAGTFDPPTLGHEDTIRQAKEIFDEVVVAILHNPQKTPFFSLSERREMLDALYGGDERIRIEAWDGAAVDLLKKEDTPFYVRGIRNTVDLEYENANFFANRRFYKDIVAVYLPARPEHLHISSTLARNCIAFGKPLEECVSPIVRKKIGEIIARRENRV